jgi:type II secretory ATPase GspE/PulE/Tfp pilus assembly ATPase PilB-like protein
MAMTQQDSPRESAAQHAESLRLPLVALDHDAQDPSLWDGLNVETLARFNCVPCGRKGQRLVLAFAPPLSLERISEAEFALGRPIDAVVAPASDVSEGLRRKRGGETLLDRAREDLGSGFELLGDDEGKVVDLEAMASESPIVRLVDSLLLGAIERRASDIHIESKDRAVLAKYRIDGALYEATAPVEKRHAETIVSRIKVMAELDIAERRIPQDGRFRLRVSGRTIDFRVSVMPSVHGEDVVIRILDRESLSKEFQELRLQALGFDEAQLATVRKYVAEPYGMILVTGPTGSGKTTTLYAALNEIASSEEKIITIEDPVEYQIGAITQVPVNEKKGLTFARGLRSILRHDPDKIMVGEVRDPETAQIAVQAALTGHLVFTTVHANNVFDVIGRFLHMGVDPYNFVSALTLVMAQRLVRVLCRSCRQAVAISEAEWRTSGIDPLRFAGHVVYDRGSCVACASSGFFGRRAVGELLELHDDIRQLILERRPVGEIKRKARGFGMRTLREGAIDKVFDGTTSLREINKVTFVE